MATDPKVTIEQMSEDALCLWVASKHCAACGDSKRAGRPFCDTDWLALPLHLRSGLGRGVDDAYFAENFRRALAHLRLFPTRVTRVLESGRRWRYHSAESLEAGGFRLIEYSTCKVPRCGASVVWYWTPSNHRMALNYRLMGTEGQEEVVYTPHRESCRDPEYFTHRRVVRTSAKSTRRSV